MRRQIILAWSILAIALSSTQASAKSYYCNGWDRTANKWYYNQILSGLSNDDGLFIARSYASYLISQYRANLPGGLAVCKGYDSFDDAINAEKRDMAAFNNGVYTKWEYRPSNATPSNGEYSAWRSDRDVSNIEFRWRLKQVDNTTACEIQFRNTNPNDSSRYYLTELFTGTDGHEYKGYFHRHAGSVGFSESADVSDMIPQCSLFTDIHVTKDD